MTIVQTILMCLTIPATLYQFLKLGQVLTIFAKHGAVVFEKDLWIMLGITWAVQVALIISLVMY